MYKLVNGNDSYIVLVGIGKNTDIYRNNKGNIAFINVNQAVSDGYLKACLKQEAGLSMFNPFDPRFIPVQVSAMSESDQLAAGTFVDASGTSHKFEVDNICVKIDGGAEKDGKDAGTEGDKREGPAVSNGVAGNTGGKTGDEGEVRKDSTTAAEVKPEIPEQHSPIEVDAHMHNNGAVKIVGEVESEKTVSSVTAAEEAPSNKKEQVKPEQEIKPPTEPKQQTQIPEPHRPPVYPAGKDATNAYKESRPPIDGKTFEHPVTKPRKPVQAPAPATKVSPVSVAQETSLKQESKHTISYDLNKKSNGFKLTTGTRAYKGGAGFGARSKMHNIDKRSFDLPQGNNALVDQDNQTTPVAEPVKPVSNVSEIKKPEVHKTVSNLSELYKNGSKPAQLPEDAAGGAREEVVEQPMSTMDRNEARKKFRDKLSPEVASVIGDIPKACLGPISAFTSREIDTNLLATQGYVYCIDHRWFKVGNWFCIDIVQDFTRYFFNAKYGASLAIEISVLNEWSKLIGGEGA